MEHDVDCRVRPVVRVLPGLTDSLDHRPAADQPHAGARQGVRHSGHRHQRDCHRDRYHHHHSCDRGGGIHGESSGNLERVVLHQRRLCLQGLRRLRLHQSCDHAVGGADRVGAGSAGNTGIQVHPRWCSGLPGRLCGRCDTPKLHIAQNSVIYLLVACKQAYGPVAQLVRAPPCHGGGHRFKSGRGRWNVKTRFSPGFYVHWLCSSVGRASD